MPRKGRTIVVGPRNGSTAKLIGALALAENIVDALLDRTLTKEQALQELKDSEFYKANPQKDKDFADLRMPETIDKLLNGTMSDEEAVMYLVWDIDN